MSHLNPNKKLSSQHRYKLLILKSHATVLYTTPCGGVKNQGRCAKETFPNRG